jgi:hypothetical protein
LVPGDEEKEPTGLSREEKEQVCKTLENFGVPMMSDGKLDYTFLKSKLQSGDNPDAVAV